MRKNISLWQFSGFAVSALLGTLLHYLYDWTGKNPFAAAFSGVNESIWEHMKLLYFPLFVFALVQSRFFGKYKNFWCIKLTGILTGIFAIPVLFYTYNGAFGKSPDWINIAIFFVANAFAFFIETKLFRQNKLKCKYSWLAFLAICFIGILFVIFTFSPPDIPLFMDN